jgi:hypothetical protein
MTLTRDRLADGKHGFDQRNGMGIVGEIPERAMTARIKNGVIVARFDTGQHLGVRQRGLSVLVMLEATGCRGLRGWKLASRIDPWLPTLGGSQGKVGIRILENVIRCCEFLQPETGFLAGVAEPDVRRQHHQYFHGSLLDPGGAEASMNVSVTLQARRGAPGCLDSHQLCCDSLT